MYKKMVLSGSKMASYSSSISNKNQGGGSKKAGLPLRSHYLLTHHPKALNTILDNTLTLNAARSCASIGGIRRYRC